MSRALICLLALTCAASAVGAESAAGRRMVVLGVDGLDPALLSELMADGLLPNFKRLATDGGFVPLGTSVPPQSPVAWSNFITGMDAGGHGIFDFVALDRQTLLPYLSSARVEKSSRPVVPLGDWRVPLGPERTVLLRDGLAFWELLEDRGVDVTIFRLPVNYPPIPAGQRVLSGMGTPDIRGTSGTFSYFTTDPKQPPTDVAGGVIRSLSVSRGVAEGALEGPPNAFRKGAPTVKSDLRLSFDLDNPVALIETDRSRALLNVGEWSDWLALDFTLVPGLVTVPGMVRVLLQQTRPNLQLYVSPVNIDPRRPAQPIAYPDDYAEELAAAAGPFYTQEMPEDTKALSAHVLSSREFLEQSELVMEERRRLLGYELKRFRDRQGSQFLFFYLSSVDQRHHMLARQADPGHPFHEPDTPPDLASAMKRTYMEVDELVGSVLDALEPGTALIVMSDHGFAPFRRQAHLNAWLERNGYLALRDPTRRNDSDWLQGIDWPRTRAFGIGLNSLYVNVRGRERAGIVEPGEREKLAREIASRLEAWRDPENGQPVVTQALVREDAYSGPHVADAPDVIVGYARGYRASWDTSTGKVAAVLLEDNDREWSGDHCMDSRTVPGVLLSSGPLPSSAADLRDMSGSILRYFGIEPPEGMSRRQVL